MSVTNHGLDFLKKGSILNKSCPQKAALKKMSAEKRTGERRLPEYKDWVDDISNHREKENQLVKRGYQLFFETAANLPTTKLQPLKHFSNYLESDINFVILDAKNLSPDDLSGLRSAQGSMGNWLWVPMRVGIFDMREETVDGHVRSLSAHILFQSVYGEIFRKGVDFHISYAYSNLTKWSEKSIDYNLMSIKNEDREKISKMSELQLLRVANNLAQIYSEQIKSQR